MTRDGVILGTAAYMSPEQARGKAIDKRTDVWAFGCVVYEMLTGRAAFAGDTLSDTIAAILEREPDWSVLPAATPVPIRRLLLRCLDKERQAPPARHRRRAHGNRRCVERRHLAGCGDVGHRACVDIRCPDGRRARQAKPWPFRSGGGCWCSRPSPVSAFLLRPAAPETVRRNCDRSSGRLFVCAAHGGRGACTFARRNQDRVRGARPRGKVVVGPVAGRVRREIADGYGRRGGPVLVTRQRRARVLRGWKPQDGETRRWRSTGARHWSSGSLLRARFQEHGVATGRYSSDVTGQPERVKPTCGGSRREGARPRPPPSAMPRPWSRTITVRSFFPDGRRFIVLVRRGAELRLEVAVGELGSNVRKPLLNDVTNAQYAPGRNGRSSHLIFVRGGRLIARPFDDDRLELTGSESDAR